MTEKYVYFFGEGNAEGKKEMKEIRQILPKATQNLLRNSAKLGLSSNMNSGI